MRRRRLAWIGPLLLCGCVPVAAGLVLVGAAAAIGTYVYLEGEGSQDYSATLDQAYESSLSVCERAKFEVTEKSSDAFTGWIVARMADGTSVRFHLRRLGEKGVHVGIRVGALGDYDLTLELHRMLGEELDERAPPPQRP